jgi:hypothetical protein
LFISSALTMAFNSSSSSDGDIEEETAEMRASKRRRREQEPLLAYSFSSTSAWPENMPEDFVQNIVSYITFIILLLQSVRSFVWLAIWCSIPSIRCIGLHCNSSSIASISVYLSSIDRGPTRTWMRQTFLQWKELTPRSFYN